MSSSKSKSDVWLGVPLMDYEPTAEERCSALASKIGGHACYFRETDSAACITCPRCQRGDRVNLLVQLYAPLEHNDRVLYVLICGRCSEKQPTCFCFALRSVNYSAAYVQATASPESTSGGPVELPAPPSGEGEFPTFDENDDWGGEEEVPVEGSSDGKSTAECEVRPEVNRLLEVEAGNETSVSAPDPATVPLAPRTTYPLQRPTTRKVGKEAACFPCMFLDVVEEPGKDTEAIGKAMTGRVRALQGSDVVDMTAAEEDDETADERLARKFMERIERFPSQCIRWHLGGEPLVYEPLTPAERIVPPCGVCGAPRRFEFQVMTPSIYFLTKHCKSEEQHHLHFGNILVFTCSGDCDPLPYAPEHCVTQREF